MSKRQLDLDGVGEHVVFGVVSGIIIGTALGVLIENIPIGLLAICMVSCCACIISLMTSKGI